MNSPELGGSAQVSLHELAARLRDGQALPVLQAAPAAIGGFEAPEISAGEQPIDGRDVDPDEPPYGETVRATVLLVGSWFDPERSQEVAHLEIVGTQTLAVQALDSEVTVSDIRRLGIRQMGIDMTYLDPDEARVVAFQEAARANPDGFDDNLLVEEHQVQITAVHGVEPLFTAREGEVPTAPTAPIEGLVLGTQTFMSDQGHEWPMVQLAIDPLDVTRTVWVPSVRIRDLESDGCPAFMEPGDVVQLRVVPRLYDFARDGTRVLQLAALREEDIMTGLLMGQSLQRQERGRMRAEQTSSLVAEILASDDPRAVAIAVDNYMQTRIDATTFFTRLGIVQQSDELVVGKAERQAIQAAIESKQWPPANIPVSLSLFDRVNATEMLAQSEQTLWDEGILGLEQSLFSMTAGDAAIVFRRALRSDRLTVADKRQLLSSLPRATAIELSGQIVEHIAQLPADRRLTTESLRLAAILRTETNATQLDVWKLIELIGDSLQSREQALLMMPGSSDEQTAHLLRRCIQEIIFVDNFRDPFHRQKLGLIEDDYRQLVSSVRALMAGLDRAGIQTKEFARILRTDELQRLAKLRNNRRS